MNYSRITAVLATAALAVSLTACTEEVEPVKTNPITTTTATSEVTTSATPATVTVTSTAAPAPVTTTATAASSATGYNSVYDTDSDYTFSMSDTFTAEEIDEMVLAAFAANDIDLPDGLGYDYASATCEGFADGLDSYEMAMIGADSFPAFDYLEHSYMIGVSIGVLCPEYSDR